VGGPCEEAACSTVTPTLNELIHAIEAKNRMIDAENLADRELEELSETYQKIRMSAQRGQAAQ
jgi:hypothetical protein